MIRASAFMRRPFCNAQTTKDSRALGAQRVLSAAQQRCGQPTLPLRAKQHATPRVRPVAAGLQVKTGEGMTKLLAAALLLVACKDDRAPDPRMIGFGAGPRVPVAPVAAGESYSCDKLVARSIAERYLT